MRKFAPIAALAIAPTLVFAQAGLLKSGPMLGYSEMTETVIWLQTSKPAAAQVKYWPKGQTGQAATSAVINTSSGGDHIARFTLTGLTMGTKYDYEVWLNGAKVTRPYPTQFQTQPLWQWRTEPPEFKVAIGSCLYVNDAPTDRPGKPYGNDTELMTNLAATKPDLMIWLGDNTYFREADWGSESGIRYRWGHTRAYAPMQALLASTHHYAIWDDHDFGPNDSDWTYNQREAALRAFKDYWANPTYGTADTAGIFGRFMWGDVEFFLLDDRYHRSPNRLDQGPDKKMFGDAQFKWLKESLVNSSAPFKVVANGNQVLNSNQRFERLADFAEYQLLLDWIKKEKIDGVLFLSGDRHHTELLKVDQEGGYPLYEFTSSSLSSGGGRVKEEENNPLRVPDTWVTESRNFGLLEFSGKRTDRVLTMRTIDDTGKERWKVSVNAKDLRWPRPARSN